MFGKREEFPKTVDVILKLLVGSATAFVEEVAEKDDGVRTDVAIGQRKRLLEVFVRIPSVDDLGQ